MTCCPSVSQALSDTRGQLADSHQSTFSLGALALAALQVHDARSLHCQPRASCGPARAYGNRRRADNERAWVSAQTAAELQP